MIHNTIGNVELRFVQKRSFFVLHGLRFSGFIIRNQCAVIAIRLEWKIAKTLSHAIKCAKAPKSAKRCAYVRCDAIKCDIMHYMAFMRQNDGEGLTRGLGCAYTMCSKCFV